MRKIIVIVILLIGVVYLGGKVYTVNTKNQLAQATGGQAITAGTLNTNTVQAGATVLFTLTTTSPLSNSEISSIYIEPIGSGKKSYATKVSSSGNSTTLSAQIQHDVSSKTDYEVMLGGAGLQWTFAERLTVTAIPAATALVLPVVTPSENESEVTNFNITLTQPDPKNNPTLYKINWTGAGRGITAWQVKGSGAGIVKQLVYQTTFPLETSGYRATTPFFYIVTDGFGAEGSSEAQLINTSSKTLDVQVTFTPRGKDNSVIPGRAKTIEVKVPPTPFAIAPTNKNKVKIGDTVTVNVKSVWPLMNLFSPLRKYPETELRLSKINKSNVYMVLDVPEFKSDNAITVTIPKELDVYTNKMGQMEKSGTEAVTPGKYRLSLKTIFGYAYYDVTVY